MVLEWQISSCLFVVLFLKGLYCLTLISFINACVLVETLPPEDGIVITLFNNCQMPVMITLCCEFVLPGDNGIL